LIADEFLLFCVQAPLTVLAKCCWINPDTSMQIIGIFLSIPAVLCGLLVQYWLYTAWFEHSTMSGTPGKVLFGLKVLDTKFKTLSFWQSTKRLFLQFVIVMLISIVVYLAIYVGFTVLSTTLMQRVPSTPVTPFLWLFSWAHASAYSTNEDKLCLTSLLTDALSIRSA
jgi:uncharacterized RDD family membrane protein YckC